MPELQGKNSNGGGVKKKGIMWLLYKVPNYNYSKIIHTAREALFRSRHIKSRVSDM